jgi:hypothetical protein
MFNQVKLAVVAFERTTETTMKVILHESCRPSESKEAGEFVAKSLRLQGFMLAGGCPPEVLGLFDELIAAFASTLNKDPQPIARACNPSLN